MNNSIVREEGISQKKKVKKSLQNSQLVTESSKNGGKVRESKEERKL